jgi:mono/diheme cytochrome c family protein
MKSVMYLVTFLMLPFAVSPVHAQAGGDPQEGLAVAQQVCSGCHVIRRGGVPFTEFTGADILRAGYRSRYDGRRLNGGTYHAARRNANVHIYG